MRIFNGSIKLLLHAPTCVCLLGGLYIGKLSTPTQDNEAVECAVFVRAAEIRQKYDLSCYDSHHASAAFSRDHKSIISTDRHYDRVKARGDLTLSTFTWIRRRIPVR
jgi:hypothetical protein